jgi:hypothetical protein
MCCESVAAWSWAPDILQVRGLCGGVGLILLVCVEGATIAFDTGFETGELAVAERWAPRGILPLAASRVKASHTRRASAGLRLS